MLTPGVPSILPTSSLCPHSLVRIIVLKHSCWLKSGEGGGGGKVRRRKRRKKKRGERTLTMTSNHTQKTTQNIL